MGLAQPKLNPPLLRKRESQLTFSEQLLHVFDSTELPRTVATRAARIAVSLPGALSTP